MGIFRNKLYIWGGGIGVVILLAVGLYFLGGKNIDIKGGRAEILNGNRNAGGKDLKTSQLAGIKCENAEARPFAVMVSSDKEARPLSGIGEADMVFEMPVVPNGFTRMMAVFQCGRPKEIGSVRSSRLDFVPLALGINAIYAHFGGEHTVLEELNSGIIDNIDGLKYDGTIYYRKPNIPKPHNAFSNLDLFTKISKELGYNLTDGKVTYPHDPPSRKASDGQGTDSKSLGENNPQPIYADGFKVDWKYNKDTNSYFRTRINKPEMDKNTGKQVEAKNVIVMKTTWSPISKDYIRVKTIGSGGLILYKNGIVITGTWEKKDDKSKLYFYDQNHKEILLAAGITWVEIVTTN